MKEVPKSVITQYRSLQKEVARLRRLYHIEDAMEIPDELLDSYKNIISTLENKYPSLKSKNSQSAMVIGGVRAGFSKITHKYRQYSLNDIFIEKQIEEFDKRIKNDNQNITPSYYADDKIDGLKIVLTYKKGKLLLAATRGDGFVGEDVTENVKEIASIPKELSQAVDITVEGEVIVTFEEFARINTLRRMRNETEFSNPRQLTAGTIRQLDTSVIKERAITYYAYDIANIIVALHTQVEEVQYLKALGFPINPHGALCATLEEIQQHYKQRVESRKTMPYGVDGVVVKVNELSLQRKLGYAGKAPRFAVAYKFPSQTAAARLLAITFQVGRTGVVTPVAELEPTLIDGSTVSRASLHNEEKINELNVQIGDTVEIRKAGDIIPEVVKVNMNLRPPDSKPFIWPTRITACGGDGLIRKENKEWFCVDVNSFEIKKLKLIHFTSKTAFDIDGCGEKTIDQFLTHGLISMRADFFTLTEEDLLNLEGWKKKSVSNLLEAIEARRSISMVRVLISLSIGGVGEEMAQCLSEKFKSIQLLREANPVMLTAIDKVGDKLANNIYAWFRNEENLSELNALLCHITVTADTTGDTTSPVYRKRVALSGTFENFNRENAKQLLREKGAFITNVISTNTDYLIIGSDPKSKKKKAEELGIAIVDEITLVEWLK